MTKICLAAELRAQSVRTIGEEGTSPTERERAGSDLGHPEGCLLIQDQVKGVGGYTTESH